MKRAFYISTRCLLLFVAARWLSACTMITGAKQIMPLEQGVSVYAIGKTPAPTVLMFPGCGGAQRKSEQDIFLRKAKWLNAGGFNAVLFDYTKIMGVDSACYGEIKPETLLKVALAAFHYTASQPFVDRRHIALLGWSMGASMALTVAEKLPTAAQPNITAVAAYYPGCYPGLRLSSHPTLLLIGLADNVVNPYDCIALANQSPQTPLVLKTYRGAYHGFDLIENEPPKTAHFLWKKFTAAYDPVAAIDAKKTTMEFLQRNN